MYTLIGEVLDFDLDDYIPHMGWIGDKPIKIYTKDKVEHFFLYYKRTSKLFEIAVAAPNSLNNSEEYDKAISLITDN